MFFHVADLSGINLDVFIKNRLIKLAFRLMVFFTKQRRIKKYHELMFPFSIKTEGVSSKSQASAVARRKIDRFYRKQSEAYDLFYTFFRLQIKKASIDRL